MKNFIRLLNLLLVLSAHEASAFYKTGAGLMIGEPVGITAKARISDHSAVDAALGFSFHGHYLIYSDYLRHFSHWIQSKEKFLNELTPYVGLGGVVSYKKITGTSLDRTSTAFWALGVRAPLGTEWIPTNSPIGLFGEVAPGVTLLPGIDFFLQGTIGARYYF